MPYIKRVDRKAKDKIIKIMVDEGIKADGDLNYVLYAFCKKHVPLNYNAIKNYCGELRQCATEIERKILGPYENEKIQKNGDIYRGG